MNHLAPTQPQLPVRWTNEAALPLRSLLVVSYWDGPCGQECCRTRIPRHADPQSLLILFTFALQQHGVLLRFEVNPVAVSLIGASHRGQDSF